MNNKDRTIKACKQIAKEYRDGTHEPMHNTCALCAIYYMHNCNCRGCAISNGSHVGCVEMNTYVSNLEDDIKTNHLVIDTGDGYKCETRAKFFDNIIPILEKIDAKYFTVKGYKSEVFEEILKYDEV